MIRWLYKMFCTMRGHRGMSQVHPQQMLWKCKACGAVVDLNPWRP